MPFNMKPLLRMIILLLLTAASSSAQCINITQPKGPDTLYGTYDVAVTTTGSTGLGGTPGCFPSYPLTFWAAPGAPGSFIFTFAKPVYEIKVESWGMDGPTPLEFLRFNMNGTHFFLTPPNVLSYTECLASGGPCTLSGGDLYAPSTGGDGADLVFDNGTGIYTFEVYCNGGHLGVVFDLCIDTTMPATNNGPMCVGSTLSLVTHNADSAGATYYWWGPGSFSSTTKNPFKTGMTVADAGRYWVAWSVPGHLDDTAYTDVVVNPLPTIVLTSNSPICYPAGSILDLYMNPYSIGETFSWKGPAGFTSTVENPVRMSFINIDTGYYTVTVTDSNGCVNKDSTHVAYAPIPPSPVISGTTVYCQGDAFIPFTAIGSGILWYTVPTGGTGNPTSPTVNTAVAGITTEWATQTIAGCESQPPRATITVTVNPTPAMPTVTGTNTYCQFDTYVPPTATGTSVLWYTAPTGGTGTLTPPSVSTATPGTYTIYATQTSALGCESARAAFVITVNAKPSPPILVANPSTYCPGQTFQPFTIISGIGLLYYTAPTGGTGTAIAPIINTLIPGVYNEYVSQTVLGCESNRTTMTVTVIDNVTAGFNYTIKYGCIADTVVFHNTSTGTINYAWKFGDGFSSIEDSPVHVYQVQAQDTVTLYSSVASCIDSNTQYINLVHPLHAYFTEDTDLICQGGSVSFADSSSVGTGISYLWEYGDNVLHPPVTTTTTSHIYPQAGMYKAYLVVKDFRPCTDTMYKIVMVDTISGISVALTDTVICQGTYVTFTGSYASLGNTGVTWTLGDGDSIKNVNPLVYGYQQPGVYNVRSEAIYRVCPDTSAHRKITVIAQPKMDLGPDVSICKGSVSITLADNVNAGNPVATWMWNTGEKTSSIVVVAPGVYSSTVRIGGCEASASVTVKNDCYMNIPNVFTPNNDGVNDYFYPQQYLSSGLISFNMTIYNRWGELVFKTNSLDGAGWDGKFNNADQPEGVYVYLIDGVFKDGQQEHHQGNVTLLR